MGNSAAIYTCIGIRGHRTKRWTCGGAPTEAQLIGRGSKNGCDAVIRYFPSKKGWRILDIRKARAVQHPSGRTTFWTGQVRGTTYYPNEDAAVMAAIHLLPLT